jgi:hypothetical protein
MAAPAITITLVRQSMFLLCQQHLEISKADAPTALRVSPACCSLSDALPQQQGLLARYESFCATFAHFCSLLLPALLALHLYKLLAAAYS